MAAGRVRLVDGGELREGDALEWRHGGKARQSERECDAAADALYGAATPVGLRDRVHDREAEPDAAVGARAGGVSAGEALEDPFERVFGDAAAFVRDLDRYADSLGPGAELDPVCRVGVRDGVL